MRRWIGIFLLLALCLTLALPAAAAAPDAPVLFAAGGAGEFWIPLVIAWIIAGLCTLVIWLSLNNVKIQDSAAHYTTPGSLQITGRHERFLRRTKTRCRLNDDRPNGPK